MASKWRVNGVSNHRRPGCLLNWLFRRRSKKTSKLSVTGLRGGFPSQRTSDAENVSIWWRHHGQHACKSTHHRVTVMEITWANESWVIPLIWWNSNTVVTYHRGRVSDLAKFTGESSANINFTQWGQEQMSANAQMIFSNWILLKTQYVFRWDIFLWPRIRRH